MVSCTPFYCEPHDEGAIMDYCITCVRRTLRGLWLTGSSVMLCSRASTMRAELDARSDAMDTSLLMLTPCRPQQAGKRGGKAGESACRT